MLNAKQNKTILTLAFLLMSVLFQVAYAQYEIRKYTINSGGGKMSGGSYELNASIGQADANEPQSSGDFTLRSGFWQTNNDLIYKSGME